MGVHDHHISAPWDDMVKVFETYGDEGFDGNHRLLQGVDYSSSFEWEKLPVYYLSDYFKARLKEDLPMSQEEQTLYEFLQTYSVHLDWPRKPPSDLPVESSIVFRPERVKQIPSRIAALDVDKGLEWYGSIWGDSYWTKDRVSTHLKKVVAFWGDAATRGDALLHTEF